MLNQNISRNRSKSLLCNRHPAGAFCVICFPYPQELAWKDSDIRALEDDYIQRMAEAIVDTQEAGAA
jgi:hypothetical protein